VLIIRASGLCQNGIFAYVSGFGQPQYTQGIMTGQGVAGVLPCIAQIVSVLSIQSQKSVPAPNDGVPSPNPPAPGPQPVKSTAALAYFLTATIISVTTLFAFSYLATSYRQSATTSPETPYDPQPDRERKEVSLRLLFRKLSWLATAVFVVFAITMVFPVYTQRIVSVRPSADQPAYLQPASFIPLAFLFWNIGDLVGRLLTAVPALSLVRRPRIVLLLALLRVAWIGLYHLCNVRGKGAVVGIWVVRA
jgi:equilibrative nucleoside transporter 1/2/3